MPEKHWGGGVAKLVGFIKLVGFQIFPEGGDRCCIAYIVAIKDKV